MIYIKLNFNLQKLIEINRIKVYTSNNDFTVLRIEMHCYNYDGAQCPNDLVTLCCSAPDVGKRKELGNFAWAFHSHRPTVLDISFLRPGCKWLKYLSGMLRRTRRWDYVGS